ncbi:hypothetical protein [Burkholderia cepacia]|uniref:hypothetical protein n=1 Tax=Burkholderia cepacia TaxID=292 RepID=UPI001CF4D445|nr:hypothetical protein [Burkholderia cepacia]MCA8077769.1 hypothetical protein [Burkholderia cepacia]
MLLLFLFLFLLLLLLLLLLLFQRVILSGQNFYKRKNLVCARRSRSGCRESVPRLTALGRWGRCGCGNRLIRD